MVKLSGPVTLAVAAAVARLARMVVIAVAVGRNVGAVLVVMLSS